MTTGEPRGFAPGRAEFPSVGTDIVSGAPGVRLHGGFAAAVRAAGVRHLQVSLSHRDDYATATATALVSTR
ncbi:MAG TPA: hypothetical protein VI248_01300 [Kineosporiaceae bacterium]